MLSKAEGEVLDQSSCKGRRNMELCRRELGGCGWETTISRVLDRIRGDKTWATYAGRTIYSCGWVNIIDIDVVLLDRQTSVCSQTSDS